MSAAGDPALARPEDLPDDALVERMRAGDASVYRFLLQRHNRRVYRAVRAVLGEERDVEDVMQDAYLAAYRALPGFEARARFATWLIRIAVNCAIDRRRRTAPAVPLDAVPETTLALARLAPPTVALVDPERRVGARELEIRLEDAIDALPEPFRAVYVLREIEGLGTFDTAACLGIEEATVRTRFHRARRLLRDALGEEIAAAAEVMPFGGERCARVTGGVLARIAR
jgi:RNA polymerase sigma-70 factor (ECF subfamily)